MSMPILASGNSHSTFWDEGVLCNQNHQNENKIQGIQKTVPTETYKDKISTPCYKNDAHTTSIMTLIRLALGISLKTH